MIQNKDELVAEARKKAAVDQFSDANFNPSKTKLGPCFQSNGRWCGSSWTPTFAIPEDYKLGFEELGRKYKDLEWLPLDIPTIKIKDFDKFTEIWEREKIPFLRLQPSDDEPWSKEDHPLGENSTWYKPEFYGMHIACNATLDFNIHDMYVNGKLAVPMQESSTQGYRQGREANGVFTKKLYKDKFFSDIIVQVMESFPISLINNILIVETTQDILPHREQSWAFSSPTEFRILLHDENTEPTVYVSDIQTGKTTYVELPEDTNSFCWSNGRKVYGIDYHGKKSYQLIVNALWNTAKMDELIGRSIAKYRDKLNYKL